MIKKLLFITFIIFISIFISTISIYNNNIIINIDDYQISTTTNFILFSTIVFLASLYIIFRILGILFYPNIKKYKKENKKLEKKFDNYIKLITKGFLYKTINDLDKSFDNLKKANKIIQNSNLSKLLESEIYFAKKDFKKSEAIFKKIEDLDINMNSINLKLAFKEAKKSNDIEEIEKLANKILSIEPTNADCISSLLDIYKNKRDWENAAKILELGLKSKIFREDKQENTFIFIYSALGKHYYDNQQFQKAKEFLRKVYNLNSSHSESNILLAQTYIALNKKQKAIKIIKNSWKENPNPRLAELFLSLHNEKHAESVSLAETLYKLNPKSFEGNLLLANAYFKAALYSKARKYAKLAENISTNKSVYELMLKIEQIDNGSSAMIANLKNKVLTAKAPCWKCTICKREYYNWQPRCNNCGTLNSIKWFE